MKLIKPTTMNQRMLHLPTNTANQEILAHYSLSPVQTQGGEDSHCAQEHPTEWVVLAPAGVVTFPVIAW